MPKRNPEVKMLNHGRYSQWERGSKDLPEIQEITDQVIAEIGVEFGYIINIKRAKGMKIYFVIEHPPFCDDEGIIEPPFDGEVYVTSNDYNFFLGDSIWAPVHDKVGYWTMKTFLDGELVAEKSINLIEPDVDDLGIDW